MVRQQHMEKGKVMITRNQHIPMATFSNVESLLSSAEKYAGL